MWFILFHRHIFLSPLPPIAFFTHPTNKRVDIKYFCCLRKSRMSTYILCCNFLNTRPSTCFSCVHEFIYLVLAGVNSIPCAYFCVGNNREQRIFHPTTEISICKINFNAKQIYKKIQVIRHTLYQPSCPHHPTATHPC